MKYFNNFGDKRQATFCIYCGDNVETREHSPSKVFLDLPYPDNLPIIYSCEKCNSNFSLDEEYVASLIECLICRDTYPDSIKREKIKRILVKKPGLARRLSGAMIKNKKGVSFKIEKDRFENVLLKLGRSHFLYECNEPIYDEPIDFRYGVLEVMSENERNEFEKPTLLRFAPEVGSRAMQNILFAGELTYSQWIIVQDGRYRYIVADDRSVRLVLSEYIWCEIKWPID